MVGTINELGKSKESSGRPVYNLSLILAFVANFFEMVGISLLFRYSDFIESIGGTAWHLGWVVGIAAVGAILFRFVQGKAVDRFGPELIWVLSLAGQVIAIAWHLKISNVNGIELYLARMLLATSIAGHFGAWLSFTSLQAPRERVAEVIGVVGSSGFLGMAVGPWIGDVLFQTTADQSQAVFKLLTAAGSAITVCLIFSLLACWTGRKNRNSPPRTLVELPQNGGEQSQSALKTLGQFHPGFLLVVGVVMGISIGFPSNFLRPWAKSIEIEQIKVYFITYNLVAFSSRIVFRRAPQWLGLKNTITVAWIFMGASMLLYLLVDDSRLLWIPAVAAGLAHSFLFPSVVAACSLAYPIQHRGLATNLILAMYDVGMLVGMPAIGMIVTIYPSQGGHQYDMAFVILFLIIMITGIVFFFVGSRHKIDDREDGFGKNKVITDGS